MNKFKHQFSNEDLVTVKFTNVTLLHKSGVNLALLSLVIINIQKLGEKSISQSPTLIKTLPPVLYDSLFNTEFKIGSIFSTSCTNRGNPNLKQVSKFLINPSSANEEVVIFLSLQKDKTNFKAYPEGSMIKGYLLNLFKIIAFSVHKLSEGSPWVYQFNL